MIHPLRQAHRVVFCVLALSLPVAFVAGLSARHQPLGVASTAVPGAVDSTARVLLDRLDFWPSQKLRTRLLLDSNPASAATLELTPLAPVTHPDVLVYWTPDSATVGARLPGRASLLGSFPAENGGRFALPPAARQSGGRLLLYSLADQETLSISEPLPSMAAPSRVLPVPFP